MKPVVIGIAGGSASGKTSVASALTQAFDSDVVWLPQDCYYRAHDDLAPEARTRLNYDRPEAFDDQLLRTQLQQLIAGDTIDRPVYDFEAHTRKAEFVTLAPKPVIIVEGILVLADPALRALMDIRLYVDTPADVRVLRRIQRDTQQRGRSLDAVIAQYLDSVRPAHAAFVAPTRAFADVIIPQGAQNHIALDLIETKIQAILAKRQADR
ncbi:uridine kinase [Lacticaseibacillus sp. GG6-2]